MPRASTLKTSASARPALPPAPPARSAIASQSGSRLAQNAEYGLSVVFARDQQVRHVNVAGIVNQRRTIGATDVQSVSLRDRDREQVMQKPRHVRLSAGLKVVLDGDLLAVIEALYKEVTLRNVLKPSFEEMRSEILSLIDQMSPADRRTYLAESLFLNSVTYENEMLSAYVRRLSSKAPRSAPREKPAGSRGSKGKSR